MKEEFIPYKQAVALKKLGFDEISRFGMEASLYDKKGKHTFYANYGRMGSGLSEGYISAPLFQQAFRWFREKHKLHSSILQTKTSYIWIIPDLYKKHPRGLWYKSYHQAEIACLKKLIEIIKNKQKE